MKFNLNRRKNIYKNKGKKKKPSTREVEDDVSIDVTLATLGGQKRNSTHLDQNNLLTLFLPKISTKHSINLIKLIFNLKPTLNRPK